MATCERCQGNGEIVLDWERYLHGKDDVDEEEAGIIASCPDCYGTGEIDELSSPASNHTGQKQDYDHA